MNAEFSCMSDKLVKALYQKRSIKSLTCHDSIWIEETNDIPDIKNMFYEILDLTAYREQKLEEL